MARLVFDTCCGCIQLKTGCLIIGYLQLVGELIAIIMIAIGMTATGAGFVAVENSSSSREREFSPEDKAKTEAALTLFMIVLGILLLFIVLALAFTITFLVGVHQNKRGHVKAYLIYAGIFLVIGLILFFVRLGSGGAKVSDIVSNVLSILLNVYFLLVVRSHYIKMGDAKGPAVYSTA